MSVTGRALINERQREGIAARKAGKQFGRKNVLSDDQVADIRERVSQGQQKSLLAAEYHISRITLYFALEENAAGEKVKRS